MNFGRAHRLPCSNPSLEFIAPSDDVARLFGLASRRCFWGATADCTAFSHRFIRLSGSRIRAGRLISATLSANCCGPGSETQVTSGARDKANNPAQTLLAAPEKSGAAARVNGPEIVCLVRDRAKNIDRARVRAIFIPAGNGPSSLLLAKCSGASPRKYLVEKLGAGATFSAVKNTRLRSESPIEYRAHGGRASGGTIVNGSH